MLDSEIRLKCLEFARDLDEAEAFYRFIMRSSDFECLCNSCLELAEQELLN